MTQAGTNSAWAATLIEGLVLGGARDAVVSPGSRHTPLVLALHQAAQSGRVRIHRVLDERTAGFFALGLARMTGQPTLLACTSGTAGSHYLPALIEASHGRLPLIALTGDRPPELQGLGAPQTTVQAGFFAQHVRLFEDMGAPEPEAGLHYPVAVAQRALKAALGPVPGPVHLNLPFRRPLWEAGEGPAVPVIEASLGTDRETADLSVLDAAADRLTHTARGLLVCGPGDLGVPEVPRAAYADRLRGVVARLARTLGWPILIDGASCLGGGLRMPGAIYAGDCIARSEGLRAALAPELVVRIGQIPTSTPLRQMLTAHGTERTLLLDATGQRHDPDGLRAEVLTGDPVCTLEALMARIRVDDLAPDPTWITTWRQAAAAISDHDQPKSKEGPLWSGAAAQVVAETLPEGGVLHLASSLAVRAFDAFAGPTRPAVQVTANRGVNGIDGTLATSFGQAAAWGGPVAVLLGDLAFLHDVGSLATLGASWDGPPWVCVVLDNQGGGIFDHLPIADHPTAYEAHFVTPQKVDLVQIAQPLVSTCVSVSTPGALRSRLEEAFTRPELTVLHVPFSRDVDMNEHQRFWACGTKAAEEAIT